MDNALSKWVTEISNTIRNSNFTSQQECQIPHILLKLQLKLMWLTLPSKNQVLKN